MCDCMGFRTTLFHPTKLNFPISKPSETRLFTGQDFIYFEVNISAIKTARVGRQRSRKIIAVANYGTASEIH